MNVMINIMVCLVLTTVNGSIFLGMWLLLRLMVEKQGGIELLYRALWFVTVSFFLPVMFFWRWAREQAGGLTGAMPILHTPVIKGIGEKLLLIWCCGIILFLFYLGADILYCLYFRRRGIRCCGAKYKIFYQVLEELGLSAKNIELYESYRVQMPMVTGLRRVKVLLPVGTYEEDELRVIFLHELIHYKQKDLWLKHILYLLLILQWFNPLVWVLKEMIWRWSEYVCDYRACRKMGGIKLYFSTILSQTEPVRGWTGCGRSLLFADQHELFRRVKKMKNCFKKEMPKKRWIYGLCAVCMLFGTVSVYASSEGLLHEYDRWFDQTDVVVAEDDQVPVELVEYEETGDNGMIEECDISIPKPGRAATRSMEWTVKAGVRKTTAEFSAKSGNTIRVTAILTPADLSVKVGIIEPDGTRRYVTGKDAVAHTFSLDQTGSYRVFVENGNSKSITAKITYDVN